MLPSPHCAFAMLMSLLWAVLMLLLWVFIKYFCVRLFCCRGPNVGNNLMWSSVYIAVVIVVHREVCWPLFYGGWLLILSCWDHIENNACFAIRISQFYTRNGVWTCWAVSTAYDGRLEYKVIKWLCLAPIGIRIAQQVSTFFWNMQTLWLTLNPITGVFRTDGVLPQPSRLYYYVGYKHLA